MQARRPSGARSRTRSGSKTRRWNIRVAIESEPFVVTLIYGAVIDDPLRGLPLICYIHVGHRSVEVSPANHIFMDREKERKRCTWVIEVKGDGLPMPS